MNAERGPAPWRARLLREFLLFALATAVAIVVTWPLAGELFALTRLADKTLDDHVYWWDFWWLHEALLVRHVDPLFCPLLFHPHGASLAASPFALPYGLLSLPLQAAFGPLHGAVVAVKLIGLLSFPLALQGLSLLLRSLGVPFWPSVLAGALFSFAPFRMLHLGRIHYLAGALVPWFLWMGRPSRAGWRARAASIAGAGLLFALAGAIDAALLLDMVVAAALLFLVEVRRGEAWRPRLASWLACGLAGTLLLSPLLVPFLRQSGESGGADVERRLEFSDAPNTIQRTLSPDAFGLCWHLLPALTEAVAMDPRERDLPMDGKSSARIAADIYESFRPPLRSSAAIALDVATEAAIALLALTAVALSLRQRGASLFALMALVGAVLALGPTRSFAGQVIQLPYAWLTHFIPGMAAGRYPPAHLRLFLLGLALLVGMSGTSPRRWLAASSWIAALAFVATSSLRPLRFEPVPMEEAYSIIASDPEPGAVLELPVHIEIGLRKMALGQIRHGRPLMSGPLTRVPKSAWSFFNDEPVVPRMLHPRPPQPQDDPGLAAEVRENLEILRRNDVRWILLRRSLEKFDPQAFGWLRLYLARHGMTVTETREGHDLARVDRG